MQNIRLRISPQKLASDSMLRKEVAKTLDVAVESLSSIQVRRKTIDARQKVVVFDTMLDIYFQGESPVEDDFSDIVYPNVAQKPRVNVVGAGPCGLFAALRLIELGYCPIVIERGADVLERRRDISELEKLGVVDSESNYSFGEGGAGAFSDGKLYTRSKKRGSVERILRIFCKFGADPKILVDAHPHIGTDKLPLIIKAMREQIIASGGEVHFHTRFDELILEKKRVVGLKTNTEKVFLGPVILATGHSARDVYRYLHRVKVEIKAKSIAVGVRLEHPQPLIDQIRYHSPEGKGQYLPPAEYVYKTQVNNRGVYSFCMCPGGFVVSASTDKEQCVVNGMSPANRGSRWANSGMVVELREDDHKSLRTYVEDVHSPLAIMEWCEAYERASYQAANQSLQAPAQRMTDFLKKKSSTSLPKSSYHLGLTSSNLHEWMPQFVLEGLTAGFRQFERNTKGFITSEAQLIGVESRTSAPVRIPRHPKGENACEHIEIEGLYPAGEGAGYAGGIVSAAVDGEVVALALVEKLALSSKK